MSDLQIGLLAIGAAVVMGVYAFNRWQERKFKRLTEQVFGAGHGDPLLDETGVPAVVDRIEPSLGESGTDYEVEQAEQFAADYSQPDAGSEAPLNLEVPAYLDEEAEVQSALPHGLDPVIEFVVNLQPGEPVPATALAETQDRLARLGKPVRWVGLNPYSGEWEAVSAAEDFSYQELAVGLQLADRNGPVSEAQLAAFCDEVQSFASQQLAVVEWSDKQAALQAAAGLDQFCLEVDVLIGLNVVSQSSGSFPATKIRALAEAAGMTLKPEGVFHFCNDQGVSLYTLCNHESTPFTAENIKTVSTHGVTLLFDVPRVPDGLLVFDQMTSLGRKLANSLGGMLVDDNIRPLSDAGIDKIRQQLATIYKKMEAKQIGAGGVRALRLFS